MKNRLLVVISTVCLVVAVDLVSAAGQSLPGATKTVEKTWSALRTADGQPDINGTWTNYDETPFEAPDAADSARLAALRCP